MIIGSKVLKGYFIWSILFLLLACNNGGSSVSTALNPKDCEWYVAHNDDDIVSNSNKLDLYALRMYPEGNYTLCADLLFEQGKWHFDENKKLLVFIAAEKDRVEDERYLVDQVLPGNKTQFSFYHQYPPDKANPDEIIEVRAVTNQSKFDPYHVSLHNFRLKPKAEETAEQIKQRVLSYLNFLNALYQHAKDNNLENAGGKWYPQPIRFYSNKVSMAYANELTDWYNCFYNEEQGIEGYKLISAVLRKVKIKGEDDNSRFINCVEQLLLILRK